MLRPIVKEKNQRKIRFHFFCLEPITSCSNCNPLFEFSSESAVEVLSRRRVNFILCPRGIVVGDSNFDANLRSPILTRRGLSDRNK